MSYNITSTALTPSQRHGLEVCEHDRLFLNTITIPRIVYEIIKRYMLTNKPCDVGVRLAQKYSAIEAESDILLAIGYDWKPKTMSKVPAIYVQRGEADFQAKVLRQAIAGNQPDGLEIRDVFVKLPVIITCVAAEPVEVVENLAEYVKQPLLYFRRTIQQDFGIRTFELEKMSAPELLKEGKNNFSIQLMLNVTYNDSWSITRNSLKMKHISIEIYNAVQDLIEEISL
jgi:hypothetical protein